MQINDRPSPLIIPGQSGHTPTRKQFFRDDQSVTKLAKKVVSVRFAQDVLSVLVLIAIGGISLAFVGSLLTGKASRRPTVTGVTSQVGSFLNKPLSNELGTLPVIWNMADDNPLPTTDSANREVKIQN